MSATSKHDAFHVGLITSQEKGYTELRDLSYKDVILVLSEFGEFLSGNSSFAMLFWELYALLMQDGSIIALHAGKESTCGVNDHESKLFIVLKKVIKTLGVELGIAFVQFGLNWL